VIVEDLLARTVLAAQLIMAVVPAAATDASSATAGYFSHCRPADATAADGSPK
jgi:hypothetical protein